MQNLTNNKIDQLPVKAKIMSKWHHWDALKELVTPDNIQTGTLCKLLSTIENKTIYEYDCHFRFAFRENEIGRFEFYYVKDGITLMKRYDVLNYGTHLKMQLSSHGVVCFHLNNEANLESHHFIGNWHDGQEYLSKQIEKLIKERK